MDNRTRVLGGRKQRILPSDNDLNHALTSYQARSKKLAKGLVDRALFQFV
jgi:hypothetical protein